MTHKTLSLEDLPPVASQFYRRVMDILNGAAIPFLVGGGHAFYRYTSIARDTKDFDIFVHPRNAADALARLCEAGYQAENKYPHWLGKAYHEGYFVDLISSSGNGVCAVDDEWFEHGHPAVVLDMPVLLAPVEEMIWQKAFIMERHRFDGSDIMHLLHHHSRTLDWSRLVRRFGDNYLVLFSHLNLYRFTYPGDDSPELRAVLQILLERLGTDINQVNGVRPETAQLCRGTLLSLLDYLPAVERWGYVDARLQPFGSMTPAEVAHWTLNFEK